MIISTRKTFHINNTAYLYEKTIGTYQHKLSKDKSVEVRSALAQNSDIPLDVIITLASDKHAKVREKVAERNDLNQEIINQLLNDSSVDVVDKVIRYCALTSDQLATLAKSSLFTTRRAVASNSNIDKETINLLMDDKEVIDYLIYNPAISVNQYEILARKIIENGYSYQICDLAEKIDLNLIDISSELISHDEYYVRRSLARNPSLDEKGLLVLARDVEPNVREAVAERNQLSKNLCEILVNDCDENVLYRLAKNSSLLDPSILLELLKRNNLKYIPACAAKNPATQLLKYPDILQSTDEYLLRNLAMNPSLPVEWFDKLVNINHGIDRALGRNLSTPIFILQSLSSHQNYDVRTTVASNPSVSIEILNTLAHDQNETVRFLVACNQKCTPDILDRLALDDDWLVRQAVAAHKNTSSASREIICKDKNKDVRIMLADPSKFEFPIFVDNP